MNGFGRASLAQINLIGCKECSFKCTDRRYLAAHSRIEHRQNTDPADDDFVDKLVVFVNDTTVKTEQIMESLVERAQGLVEELIDFKSSFPKCDNITAKYDYHDVDNTMEQVETSVETSSTTESGLFSDFGLSALSNLTQLARLTQNNASTTAASNTESQSGTGMFNNVSASNSKNNNILSSSISSSNSKSANTAKSTTITIAPKQANSSTTSLSNPVVITLDQLKQATTHHTMKESQRQRAHPENAPACPICGRVCSTTWNLKQHIEKHYDIHPQKGVVKKKFEETRSAATNNSLGSNSGAALAVNPATSLSFAPSPSSPSSSSLGIIELPTSSNDMSDSNEVTVKQEPLDEVENITGSVSKLAARSFPASPSSDKSAMSVGPPPLSKPVLGLHHNFLRSSHRPGQTSANTLLSINKDNTHSESSSHSSKNSSPMSLSHLFNSPSPLNQPNPSDLGYPRFPLQPTPFPVQPPGTNRNEIFVPQVPNVPKVFAHFGKGTEMLATYEKFESALRRGIPKVEDTTTPQPVLNFCANPTPNPNMNLPNQPDRQSQSSQNSSELVQEKDSQHGGEDLSKGDSEDNVSADNNANDTPQSSNGTSPVVKKRRPEVQLMPKPSIVAIPTATPVTFAIASTTAVPIKNSGSNPNTRSTAINSTVLNRLPSPSDNNHICSFCGKGWKTRSALEMHIRVHTGEEPFICALCGKGHKQKGQLKVHITKHHAGCSYPDPSLTAGAAFQHEKEKLKILRGARPIAPAPVDCSPKVNPVLSRQTEFDCHQCGLACHSWANLEKHLQAHEEADVAGDSTSENKMSILESDKMCSSDEERDKMSEGEG